MKYFLASILAMLLFFGSIACAANYKKVHPTTYKIEEATLVDNSSCSATAIGPHALLTASHCEMPVKSLILIDMDGNEAEVAIHDILRDDNDHTIYIVGTTFKEWAKISEDAPEAGEDVFYYGNPGEITDVFKKGYIQMIVPASTGGLFSAAHPAIIVFSALAYPGDSGAGVFNDKDEIVTVVTGTKPDKIEDQTVYYSFGFSFGFTKEQLTLAQQE